MSERAIALISAHTSPLAPLGGRETGGMNVYVRETAIELARLGYAVDVFTRDDGALPGGRPVSPAPGVRVIPIEAGPRAPLEKEEQVAHLPGFLNALRAFRVRDGRRYALVHSHYWMSGWVGRHLQRLWDVPHLTMFHTLGEVKRRARIDEREPERRIEVEGLVARTADRIVVASGHERGLLRRLYGAPEERMRVIPCGVDLDRFSPGDRAAARRALGLAEDGQVVLFVGRLEPLKGVEILIDAVAELEDNAPTLLIAGGDNRAATYMESLRERARAAGIGDRTRFAGAVPQPELVQYYRAADLCAVPSFYESFGLVALEAMACGVPVIASRVGGLVSTVKDGETGYLIPWRCAQPFADKIDLLLSNTALREAFSGAAVREAQRFRWPAVAAELAALYDTVLAERAEQGCHADAPATPVAACHA